MCQEKKNPQLASDSLCQTMHESLNARWFDVAALFYTYMSCIIKWDKMYIYKLNALFKKIKKGAFHLRKGLQQRQI